MNASVVAWEGRVIGLLAVVGLAGTLLDQAFQGFLMQTAPAVHWPSISIGLDGVDYAALASATGARAAAWTAFAVGLVGSLLPWLAALTIGSALRANAPESTAVAAAFRRLALAFVGFMVLRLLAAGIIYLAWHSADAKASLDVSSLGLSVGTIAALLAWRMSRITARAVEHAREIEAIV